MVRESITNTKNRKAMKKSAREVRIDMIRDLVNQIMIGVILKWNGSLALLVKCFKRKEDALLKDS